MNMLMCCPCADGLQAAIVEFPDRQGSPLYAIEQLMEGDCKGGWHCLMGCSGGGWPVLIWQPKPL